MKREALPESVSAAIEQQSREVRSVLGWLRMLGPLDTRNLALAAGLPPGAVFGICRQLQTRWPRGEEIGAVWRLSDLATAWADQQDRRAGRDGRLEQRPVTMVRFQIALMRRAQGRGRCESKSAAFITGASTARSHREGFACFGAGKGSHEGL